MSRGDKTSQGGPELKLAAFDLETAKVLPEDIDDIKQYAPLGITCAAVALSDTREPLIWQGVPQLSQSECQALVRRLEDLVESGYTLVTWNGTSFDFFVLAQESGMYEECGKLALRHVDLMAVVTFSKGHYLALDKALKGAGLEGKASHVKLSDGSFITDMSGVKAPAMWAAGEREAVLDYLRQDVTQLLELTRFVQRTHAIYWMSSRGNPQAVTVGGLLTVKECFALPRPNVEWMDTPPTPEGFVEWIPGWEELVGMQWQTPDPARRPAALPAVQATGSASAAQAISQGRGCLHAVGALVILGIPWVTMLATVPADFAATAPGAPIILCGGLLVLGGPIAAFFYFRERSRTIKQLFRRKKSKSQSDAEPLPEDRT